MKTLPTVLLLTATLALSSATVARAATVSNWLALTITNPTPAASDYFGSSVAAVGADRVLIAAVGDNTGAINAGAAYLFSANGALLTTFTNPAPGAGGPFANSVAALGVDRIVIGGANATRAAYLFSTNGALLATFTGPTLVTGDGFGSPVAAVGADYVLIGAYLNDTGASNAGAAYLFSTNGTLLTTLTNPTPVANDYFGWSVAAVGTDGVLVGAWGDDTGAGGAGAAYLFSTNGTLLTTFTNPTPEGGDFFSASSAGMGTDLVLIGARGDHTSALDVGAAYLFSTNGELLTTFTNPTPAASDHFGWSVAAVATDRVLIGALDDSTGATNAGTAYLFSTNGTLLTTITNPTPASDDRFGSSVAAVGTDRLLIGAYQDDTGAGNSGAAYLFSLEPLTPPAPSLSTSFNPQLSTLTISWPAPAEGWLLERNNALPSVAVATWPQVPPPYHTNADTISVTLTNLPTTGDQFYRLRQP